MTRPLIQIINVATGEETIRELTDEEIAALPVETPEAAPTKEQLLAELQVLTAKIQALS